MASRRKKESGLRDKIVGVLLVMVAITLLSGLGMGWWWIQNQTVVIDEKTNCPTKGPHAVHVLIFDRTDPITQQQAQQIKQHVTKLMGGAKTAQRFDLYTIEGNTKTAFDPVLQTCSPGRGQEANALYQNPELIERRFQQKFVAALQSTIDQLLRESTLPNSPIIESIKGAAITSLGSLDEKRIPFSVTVFSDMVQHSQLASQIRGDGPFGDLAKSAAWRSLQPNLRGADVHIVYLLRANAKRPNGAPIQNRGHQVFWEDLIRASNGRLMSIEPL